MSSLKARIKETLVSLKYALLGTMDRWPKSWVIAKDMRRYKKGHGYSFDIHAPVLFTEKVQWYKFFHNRPEIERITDKVQFKKYIEEKLGPGFTVRLLGHWDSISEFEKDYPSLPHSFVLKSNLQGDGRCIRIVKNKANENFNSIKEEVEKWLIVKNTLKNSCDCYLFSAKPQILAEEYISEIDGQLHDYKFLCFSGEPTFAYISEDHFSRKGENKMVYSFTFYDMAWNELDVTYGPYTRGHAKKPKQADEMIRIARVLSSGFPFVRVDFFETADEKVLISEMTFNPGGGVPALLSKVI